MKKKKINRKTLAQLKINIFKFLYQDLDRRNFFSLTQHLLSLRKLMICSFKLNKNHKIKSLKKKNNI